MSKLLGMKRGRYGKPSSSCRPGSLQIKAAMDGQESQVSKVSMSTEGSSRSKSIPDIVVTHAPDIERMLRGLLTALGLPKEEVARIILERRSDGAAKITVDTSRARW